MTIPGDPRPLRVRSGGHVYYWSPRAPRSWRSWRGWYAIAVAIPLAVAILTWISVHASGQDHSRGAA